MDGRYVAFVLVLALGGLVFGAVLWASRSMGSRPDPTSAHGTGASVHSGSGGTILRVSRADGRPVKIPVTGNPNVEIRYTVHSVSRAGIESVATCLDCKRVMLQKWDTRSGPASQFLWFKCPECQGVTWMLEGNLLGEGEFARDNPEHRSRIFKMTSLPFEPPTFEVK